MRGYKFPARLGNDKALLNKEAMEPLLTWNLDFRKNKPGRVKNHVRKNIELNVRQGVEDTLNALLEEDDQLPNVTASVK